MTDVLLLGEPMGLFSATGYGSLKEAMTFNKSVAGAEINVGIGLSRLGHQVEYITKLGKDPIGEFIFEALQKEAIGTNFVTFDEDHNTGLMLKNKVKDDDPDTAYYRKSSAFSTLSKKDVENIDFNNIKVLHVTGIPPALSPSVREAVEYLMQKAKKAGTFITFDPNLRPALWESTQEMLEVLNALAKYADVVLPGISEGETLVGSSDVEAIAQFYKKNGADVVITKSGSQGAYVTEKSKETINVSGFKVEKVIDTVGAGDGFAVGILHAYLEGLNWKEAATYANAIGSLQVQHAGDNEGLPTKEVLNQYVEQNKK
ncbi:sugar kinase [Marinilactibacillus psychrotolerans]|uniref:Sugar kinase n=1 Tax=Marinilactibacillus psychrotolerans TaxID=191770 RepID=A0A5R9C271_9LACT|nr:sugar kinase [Marinilactibacillus psychrotolerans]TLQ06823.1 sugar kinase [Marinilactibacillus psychrotolerans]